MEQGVNITLFAAIVAVAACIVAFNLYKENQHLKRRIAGLTRPRAPFVPPAPAPPKTPEQEYAAHLDRQREAVIRQRVTFTKRRIMGRGEFELFRSAMGVTRQPFPTGAYPYFVFPQVSLGQIIGTGQGLEADEAHRAINSKRCDLTICNRSGTPLAVIEFQGSGHNIGGTATRRDEIKKIALERAGVRFIEIQDGTQPTEIQRIIRELLARQQSPTQPV